MDNKNLKREDSSNSGNILLHDKDEDILASGFPGRGSTLEVNNTFWTKQLIVYGYKVSLTVIRIKIVILFTRLAIVLARPHFIDL